MNTIFFFNEGDKRLFVPLSDQRKGIKVALYLRSNEKYILDFIYTRSWNKVKIEPQLLATDASVNREFVSKLLILY